MVNTKSVYALPFLFFSALLLTAGCGSGGGVPTVNAAFITEPTPPGENLPPPAEALPSPDGFFSTDLGLARAVGFYSSGRVELAENFPDSGVGFYRLFLPRDRGWATRSLINMITGAAASVVSHHPNGGRLGIGDASRERGGYASGHASHQNGLDVDLRYYAVNQRELNPDSTSGFDEQFVRSGKLTSNFDLVRNWALVKSMVSTGMVSRMFVDPAIKRAMCAFKGSPGATEVLRRLRPYSNHANHIHVRIRCPANSRSCVPQSEIPRGDGC